MSARGAVIGVVVVVVVLGAGAVGADRWAAGETQDRAVDAIEQNLEGVVGTPSVDVGSFPFLTQIWAGSIDDVTGHVQGATLGGLDATDVDVEATGVSTSEPYTADHATVSATLPTASIEKVVADRTGFDLKVALVGDELKVSGSVLGLTLAAQIQPRVADGKLLVDITGLSLGGLKVDPSDIPGGGGSKLEGIDIPVDGLPEGLALTDATVTDEGLRITAEGDDVVLTAQS
ncbi:LmeA family phospholipid-binding protein [Cellulomonas rhizosphaerae]|uniref:DUF2993 domain-containing protein n=1 Tax=Cellulomonas rhizosphaerae TaxID=2293719 RepID=A0A413RH28_9CELL|nr:DUF2993 domain-containing protein [Cellulomonas rhizosphaerae]RHA37086.1 DUF2993 domain-containing protein [Cellulomonas rhizosphaerae]